MSWAADFGQPCRRSGVDVNRFAAIGRDLRLLPRWNAGAIRPWRTSARCLRSMPASPKPLPAGHPGCAARCHHFSPRGAVLGTAAYQAWFFDAAQALDQPPHPQPAASLRVNGVQEVSWPRLAVRETGQDRDISAALYEREHMGTAARVRPTATGKSQLILLSFLVSGYATRRLM